MHVMGYLIWMGLSILLTWQVVRRIPASLWWRRAIGSLLAVVLILLPFWDVILGAPTFNRICQREGGLVRYEQVNFPLTSVSIDKPALSQCYYCLVLLVMDTAAETQANIRLETNPLGLTDRPGPVSYKLADEPDAACAPFDAALSSPLGRTDLWKAAGKRDDGRTCIVGTPIEEISADYELIEPRTTEEHRGLIIVKSRSVQLRRRGEDRPLAALTHFTQLSRIASKTIMPPLRSCPQFESPMTSNNFTIVNLMEKLLQQNNSNGTPQ